MNHFMNGFADEVTKIAEDPRRQQFPKGTWKSKTPLPGHRSTSWGDRKIKYGPSIKPAPDPKPKWEPRKSSVRAPAMEPSRAAVQNVKDWNESVRGGKGNRSAALESYESKKSKRRPTGRDSHGNLRLGTPEQTRRSAVMSGPNQGRGWANFLGKTGPGSVPGMLGKDKRGKNNLDGYIGGKEPPTRSEVMRKAEFGGISPKARLPLPGKPSRGERRYSPGARGIKPGFTPADKK